jgi:pyruvate dehydrogenase E2 component (dihydrolipoamide acetyltransferase)
VATDFTLPELGENVTDGEVLRVLVKAGDTLEKDQPVVELETDKATIEVPSSVAGKVTDVKVKPGDKVKVGQAILSVEGGAPEEASEPKQEPSPQKQETASHQQQTAPQQEQTASQKQQTAPQRQQTAPQRQQTAPQKQQTAPELDTDEPPEVPPAVGEPEPESAVGASTPAKVPDQPGFEQHAEGSRRPPEADKAGAAPPSAEAADEGRARKVVDITRGTRQTPAAPEMPVAPAAPSVRRMARELGVNVDQVPGSGPGGRISVDDVKAHAKRLVSEGATGGRGAGAVAAESLPDFTRWGEIDRQPMRPVRRKTAEHLSAAWTAIPHVTQHDLADITGLEELRTRYAKQAEAAGGSLTITAIAVKVAAAALKVFPQFNSSIDLAAGEIVYKKYVNIGVAVDTERGLLVPVIRDADSKNIVQISVELRQLSEKARSRKISLDEMQGGCFSISNLGGIGGSFFTPIVNAPEVAVLGISRARMEPVYDPNAGSFVPRLMLPLSLSYDHRVIDGADGIRFLRWIVEALEHPFLLALQG